MIEDEEGFERFQDLVRAIEKSVDQPDVAAKRQEIEKTQYEAVSVGFWKAPDLNAIRKFKRNLQKLRLTDVSPA